MSKMRNLACVVIVLAIGSIAWGSTPPWGGGAIYCHLNDYDMSRIYTGYLADGNTAATSGTIYTDPDNELEYYDSPRATSATETGWGVFRIAGVYEAEETGPNNLTKVSPPNILWQDGDGGKEIVGIYYGQTDVSVQFVDLGDPNDPGSWLQIIRSEGASYDLYYQDWKTWDEGNWCDPNDPHYSRATPTTDPEKYDTVGWSYDPNSLTWTADPNAELVLSAVGVKGDQAEEIEITFTPPSSGNYNTYLDITGGSWEDWFVDGLFPFGGAGGTDADLRLKATTSATNLCDWTLSSSDPLTGATIIPEPVTMLALGLGVAGIGGYIRKRRR